MTRNMYPFHMTTGVNGFPFRYSGQTQWNCIEWLIKGGLEPSILDDLCLGNVLSKYFSKLRFGTSKIQPELKCLENALLSFMNPFCGQALRTRVVSCSFNCIHFHCTKNRLMNLSFNTKHSAYISQGNVTSVAWWVVRCHWQPTV